MSQLPNEHIARYSRQLLIPAFGVAGQERLCAASVLVIGCGGLGSAVALYLAGAGVGRMGLADHDAVESSNLHRQVIHQEAAEGQPKVESARKAILALNSLIQVDIHQVQATPESIMPLVEGYDVVVDATDNPTSRYLINDACVFAGKPLVAGSAIGLEGQITVYNYTPPPPPKSTPSQEGLPATPSPQTQRGPCYRCVYPKAPSGAAAPRCADNGVLGPIVGVIGSMQALETIKVVAGMPGVLCGRITIYDGIMGTFCTFKLRPQNPKCAVCGDEEHRTIRDMASRPDLTVGCAASLPRPPVPEVSCKAYASEWQCCTQEGPTSSEGKPHLLLDVRSEIQFQICRLPGALNVPYKKLQDGSGLEEVKARIKPEDPCFVICRRGVDSVSATDLLVSNGFSNVHNVRGGLTDWAKEVDPTFPSY